MCVRSLGYIVGAFPPCVSPFIGRQSLLDPCMLPTPLCGIFFRKFNLIFKLSGMVVRVGRQASEREAGGAPNYQAIQEAKKGEKKPEKTPVAEETKDLKRSYVVYEIVKDGLLKFVKII